MTRKLGRLLVVALVVAAVVTPVTVASADLTPVLTCAGEQYDETNPYHILYPTSLDMNVKFFVNKWDLWENRHWGGTNALSTLEPYRVFNMNDVADVLGTPPAGEHYVFFWDDELDPDPIYQMRIVGTPYDDIICGSPYDDVILGKGGNDYIIGGSQVPISGPGDMDIITGGPGDDVLIGGHGWNLIAGNKGNDTLFGYYPDPAVVPPTEGPYPYIGQPFGFPWVNELFGGPGNDTIYTQDVYGSLQGDHANGGGGADKIVGGDKTDWLVGNKGNDTITGGAGDDWIRGGAGADTIWGEEGADKIDGLTGNDTLYASSPDLMCNPHLSATCVPDTASDVGGIIYGGGGDDTIYAGFGSGGYYNGNKGGDAIHGSIGIDYIWGGAGDDWIKGGGEADVIRGGLGDDTIFGGYAVPIGGVEPMMADGVTPAHPDLGDTIWGGAGGDAIYGERGNDRIDGGDGPDWINGGSGNDDLYGDAGNDTLLSGDGTDLLVGGDGTDVLDARGNTVKVVMYGYDMTSSGDSLDASLASESKDGDVDTFYGGRGDNYFVGGCADLDVAHLQASALAVPPSIPADPVGNYLYWVPFYDGAIPTIVQACTP